MPASPPTPAFSRHGAADTPRSPLVISVCHAGRDYPGHVLSRARIPMRELMLLEDRLADLLVAPLIARGEAALIARVPRALIDLNRDERDIDRRMLRDAPRDLPFIESQKQRGGLGLFPRSLPRSGEIWRGTWAWEEMNARIAGVHAPYHSALGAMMDAAVRAFGVALLVDIHSMPPLAPAPGASAAVEMVVGDRFGASADARFSSLAQASLAGRGHEVALNHPYSGFHLLERHGRPALGRHALQIEVSRALYLDSALESPGTGLVIAQQSLVAMVDALIEDIMPRRWAEAAE